MVLEISYRDLMQLEFTCQNYLNKIEGVQKDESGEVVRVEEKETTELAEIIRKFLRKQVAPIKEEFEEELYIVNVRCAAKDEKKVIKKNGNQFLFTEEGEIKRQAEIKKLKNKVVKIHTRYVSEVPDDLDAYEKMDFEGVFWPESGDLKKHDSLDETPITDFETKDSGEQ